MTTQMDKANRFQALHQGPDSFVIANVWDPASARLLTGLGFQALATSSGASASILGRNDGQVTREEAFPTKHYIYNADGSITLYIQNKSPGPDKESNWLPAPDGPIYLVMRLYWPKEAPPSILPAGKGTWQPPGIRKA